jgi:hypothetical protein
MLLRRHFALIFILGALAASPASAQTTVTLTGGDPGEGLTLNPSNIVAAYNMNGGSFTMQGVEFQNLLLGQYRNDDVSQIPNYSSYDPFESGQNSDDDAALRGILRTLAFDNPSLTYTFTGLTPNGTYRFDLLYYVGYFNAREQAIVVNGTLITLVTVSKTEAKDTYFSVQADGSGELNLLVEQSNLHGGTGYQDGAVLNAVVLSAVPEPSTYAAILGTFALGLVLWRRRKTASAAHL